MATCLVISACGGDSTAELDPQPDLQWGPHPIIADLGERRYFMSPGSEFAERQELSAQWLAIGERAADYTLFIDDQPVAAGADLALQIRHGDRIALELQVQGTRRPFDLVVSALPVLAISADEIVDEPKLPGRYRWVDGDDQEHDGERNLAIELRGVTAQEFPKKPFAIEFRNSDNPDKTRNVQLLNLRDDDDWIADAAYRDLSFARNLVSHDIYRDMQPQAFFSDGQARGQASVAGGFAELILNRQYHGLYVIHERIDRKLLDLEKVSVPSDDSGDRWDLVDFALPENGSVLFKAQAITANFYRPETIRDDYEQKYPDPQDADRFDQLEALFEFVNNAGSAEFSARIGDIIELSSIVDMWLLRLLTANTDTLNKNYYLARNESGKWFFQPWDYDATFGVNWRGGESYAQTIDFFRPEQNLLVRRLHSLPQSGFNALAQARWSQLREELFTATAIRARFDRYLDTLGADTGGDAEHARNRNLRRWPQSGNDGAGNSALGDSSYIEMWLVERLAYLDAMIAELPLQ